MSCRRGRRRDVTHASSGVRGPLKRTDLSGVHTAEQERRDRRTGGTGGGSTDGVGVALWVAEMSRPCPENARNSASMGLLFG
jgi:hypothetical protein